MGVDLSFFSFKPVLLLLLLITIQTASRLGKNLKFPFNDGHAPKF